MRIAVSSVAGGHPWAFTSRLGAAAARGGGGRRTPTFGPAETGLGLEAAGARLTARSCTCSVQNWPGSVTLLARPQPALPGPLQRANMATTASAEAAAAPCRRLLLVVVAVLVASAAMSHADPNADGRAAAAHARHLLAAVRPRASAAEQVAAVRALARRLLPASDHLFALSVDPAAGPPDTFQVAKLPGRSYVNITGTSGVAAAWGLHFYLSQVCGCHVSWDYDQLALPDPLPDFNITVRSVDRYRYYQNVCTTSYSFVWWDWARWERELDWMALNGINMALAFTGQEAVWQRVYRQLGLGQDDVDRHFTGPAFLAWLRMGNVRGWAGPLSAAWHAGQRVLQHRVLARMRELGIIAVLPAFAGHVPRGFASLFPNSTTTPLQKWNRFPDEYCCPLLLDPTDPVFHRVGTLFMKELIAEFGTDHIYNSDTFNEMRPADGRPEYLAQVGKAVYESLVDVDPDAVWMIQNWLFVHDAPFWTDSRAKALLTSVPQGRMLVLDLMAELKPQYLRLDSYYGQPFIWCMLHNFGGTLGLYGAVNNVNRNPYEARALAGSTMVGTGLTMEGTGQNYAVYDFANELAWRALPANLTRWFSGYARRRYGAYHPSADESWQLLKGSVYDNQDALYAHHGRFVLTLHPALDLEEPVWYRVEAVRDAWRLLLAAAPLRAAPGADNYRYDLVDLSRQGLQLAAAALYKQAVRAYNKRQRAQLREASAQMMQLFSDLDRVLSSEGRFMLGPWLRAARQRAASELEEAVFEWNARNQLTLWGPRGEIRDYAAKQWAGLVGGYYRPRWQRFLRALAEALDAGVALNQTAVTHDVFVNVEEPFTLDRTRFPHEPSGDPFEICQELYDRWSPLITTKAVVGQRQGHRRRPRPSPRPPAVNVNPATTAATEPAVVTLP